VCRYEDVIAMVVVIACADSIDLQVITNGGGVTVMTGWRFYGGGDHAVMMV
jgi:hypothetical protein